MYKKLKDILEDGKVTDDEIDSLKTEAVIQSHLHLVDLTHAGLPENIGHLKNL